MKIFLEKFRNFCLFSQKFPIFPRFMVNFLVDVHVFLHREINLFQNKIVFFLDIQGKMEGKIRKFLENSQKMGNFPKKILIPFSRFSDVSLIYGEFFSERSCRENISFLKIFPLTPSTKNFSQLSQLFPTTTQKTTKAD